MRIEETSGPAPSGSGPRPAEDLVGEADEESFPASDAPGWITQTTIGPPSRGPAADADVSFPSVEDQPMNADARRIIVTESHCHACSVQTVYVHHQDYPEVRIEDISAEQAAMHLLNRLEAARAAASDSLHREAIRRAIDDARAFLDRAGPVHLGRDARGQAATPS